MWSLGGLWLSGLNALVGPVAVAHHSFASTFDPAMPVSVSGRISRVEWKNPHVWFFLGVVDTDGTVTTWGFESNPPGVLQRAGFSKDRLRIGTAIVVEGFRTRDGTNNGYARTVTLPDGRNVFGIDGPAAGGASAE
jgi:hypothetical protein